MSVSRLTLLWAVMLVGGGLACSRPVGWFRADKVPTAEDEYDQRFEPIRVSDDGPCDPISGRQGDPTHSIIVLVPGIGGDGPEMRGALPQVMGARPASVFMFRYTPFEERDELAKRLAAGLSRLAACIPQGAGRILVLAHSAGGVLSCNAVSRLKAPPDVTGDWLTLITVASPLAGTNRVPAGRTPPAQRPLMYELGVAIPGYPEPVPGVRVVHLRTSAKSDEFMGPSGPNGTHLPNDPKIGSPGAPMFDLPEDLSHGDSLIYVAKKISDGTYLEWLPRAAAALPTP